MFVCNLTNEELGDEIQRLAAHIDAAVCEWLDMVAEFDRREGWAEWGMASCAHWLAWRCSIARGTAREHVRVARALEPLALVHAAFARGELSYSKVRAVTRVENVALEQELLDLARYATATQLERIVAGYRGVTRAEAQRAIDARFLTVDQNEDGSWTLRGRLPAEDGALLARSLDAAREALEHADAPQDVPAGTPDPVSRRERDADALVVLADSLLTSGPRERTAGDRYQVVVHVDAATLADPAPELPAASSARCELEAGPMLARETARRLCCDAGIVPVLEREGKALSVGRKTRSIPPALRRALKARDGGCRFPGCTCERWVDAHHIEHWARGGHTELGNLVQLCRRHHRLVHEGGWVVERTRDGTLAFLDPSGRRLRDVPRRARGDCVSLLARQRRQGVAPAPGATVPGWMGEPLELGNAVEAVLEMTLQPDPEGAAGVPAGTREAA
ncbi:MAG: hypothetical protein QOH62_3391 [Solirubrobacteraceae bacterium]|nr:hypothetical protein [Solirubrobacteraceae bacterium]